MKKFINKNLAVILSFAIVLCTLLPVMSGIVGAAGYDAAAIAELKDAWSALTVKETANPSVLWDGLNNPVANGLTLMDSMSYSGTDLSDKTVLGDKYVSYDSKGSSAGDQKDYIIFDFSSNETYTIGDLKDFSVYVKNSADINIRPNFHVPTGTRGHNESFFAAEKIGVNIWTEIKMSELPDQAGLWANASTGIGGLKDRILKGIGFDIGGVGNVTLGTMTFEFAAVNAATLALADTNAGAFVDAAKAFRTEAIANGYYASDDALYNAFSTALNKALGDTVKRDGVADAWADLTVETYFIPDNVWSANGVETTGLTTSDTSAYTGTDLADTSVLGPKFATYTSVTDTGASNFDNYILFSNRVVGSSLTLNKLKGYSLYVKAPGFAARPKLHFENGGIKWWNQNFYNATQFGGSSWTEIKMTDLPEQNNLWKDGASADSVKTSSMSHIGFDLSGTGSVTVGSIKMTFDAVDADTLALKNSNENAFKAAAKAFYIESVTNNYFASDDAKFLIFKEALMAYVGDVEQEIRNQALADAWSALSDITREFVPDLVWNGQNNPGSGLVVNDTSAYSGTDLADKSVLGSKYATYTVKTKGASDWVDHILFSSVGDDASLNIKNLKGYSFYIKASANTLARPRVRLTNTQQLWNNGSMHTEAHIGSKEWKLVNSADMAEQSKLWTMIASDKINTTDPVAQIGLDFSELGGASTDIIIGSMFVKFSAVNSDTLALAKTDGNAFVAAAETFLEEAEANGYYAANDAKFIKFKEALVAAQGAPSLNKLSAKLAKEWQRLKVVETLVPSVVWSTNYVEAEGLNVYDSSAYTGNDIDKALLGPKYATYTTVYNEEDKSDASDFCNYIIFKRADGKESAFNIGKFQSFSVYINNGTGSGVRPRFHTTTGMSWNDGSFYNENISLKDTWVNHSTDNISDVASFKNSYAAVAYQKLVGIGFDFAGVNTPVTVGSMEVVFSAVDSATLALAESNPTAFLAEAMYFYDSAVAGGIFSEDDVNFAKFAEILNAMKQVEGNDEQLAIATLMSEWKQLDASTYPTVDTVDWSIADWVYAANKIDISGFAEKQAFIDALANATALRDELGMSIGCNFSSFATVTDAEADIVTLGQNVFANITPIVNYSDGTDKTELVDIDGEPLVDGIFDTSVIVNDADFTNEGSYVEFIYGFDGAAEVTDFLVGFTDELAKSSVNYRIYAAKEMHNLFLDSSIVASCDNEAGDRIQRFNYTGKPTVVGTYIAFRFYGNTNGLNVSELAAYGKVSTYSVTTGYFSDAEMQALGTNLLAQRGVVAYLKEGKSTKQKWQQAGLNYPVTDIIDGSSETGVGFGLLANMVVLEEGEEISLHIIFDLKKTYYLEKLLVNHWHEKYLQAGLYDIYASTEMAILNRSESKILTYNNMVDGENSTTEAQIFTAMGEGKIARYVDFHIRVPISDYKNGIEKYGHLAYTRMCDLGVYGREYNKPYAEVNFLPHVPVDVYRSDATGNNTTIGENEYSGDDYKLAYDGKYDVAPSIAQNGKDINFIFNLCANKAINKIQLSTLTENIKGLKVYASETLETIWNEDTKVMDYSGEAVKQVSRTFTETPVGARYIRFCITDTASGTFDPAEFEVIGGNTQEFLYMNLMAEKSDSVSLWLQDKDEGHLTSTHENANEYNSSWNAGSIYAMEKAFDGEEGTVADFYGGSLGNADGSGKVTYSFLMDLGNLMAIDSINFIAGSSEDYWPTEINFYFGEDNIELFNGAKPVKEFKTKTDAENGSYLYEFLPEIAQYVRIEVVESSHEHYDKTNFIATVVAEMQVNGLEIIGFSAGEGIAASVTHKDTGIRADVVALRDNDVFATVQDIEVVSRPATDDEKKALAEQGAIFASDIYDIYLLDANQNVVTDVGGREIQVYIPKSLFKGSGEPYVLTNQYGELVMVEFTIVDDYYVITVDDPFGISVAFCEFSNIDFGDDPSDMNNDLSGEDDDESTENEDDDDKPKRKKIKVVRKNNDGDFDYLWLIIGGAIAVVLIAAGITLFLILKKKKDREEE